MNRLKIRWLMVAGLVLALAGTSLLAAACTDLPGGLPTTAVSSSDTTLVGVETSVVTTVSTTTTTAAPATTTTAAPATTTTHATAPPITTTTLDPSVVHIGYIQSVHHLLNEIDVDETRIPELAAQISSMGLGTPGSVREELVGMTDFITMYLPEASTTPPAGYENAQYWLGQAAGSMLSWIANLVVAIDAMKSTGMVTNGVPYLGAASGAQAAYTAAKAAHYAAIPSY